VVSCCAIEDRSPGPGLAEGLKKIVFACVVGDGGAGAVPALYNTVGDGFELRASRID
jgi:hypothetical protein